MNLRRLLLLVLPVAFVLVGAVSLILSRWPAPPTPGITVANGQRLRVGMTLADVEAILGGQERLEFPIPVPPDALDSFHPPVQQVAPGVLVPVNREGRECRRWEAEAISIRVFFSAKNEVLQVVVLEGQKLIRQEDYLEMLRRWLHL